MKKKIASLLLALTLCLSLAVPALAAEKTIKLGYKGERTGTEDKLEEVTNDYAIFSVTGDLALKETVDMNHALANGEPIFYAAAPVYTAAGPVKIVTLRGDLLQDLNIPAGVGFIERDEVQRLVISSVSYDSSKKTYTVTKANPVFFDGTACVSTATGEKNVSIEELITKNLDAEAPAEIRKGATVTLSAPGIYAIYQRSPAEDLDGGFFVEITGSGTPSTSICSQFTDVAANSPYKDAIDWAVKEGITNGTTPTTFGPNNTCTVSHILTFLWRAAGKPGNSMTEWAAELSSTVRGLNRDMQEPCTRAMAVAYMWAAAGKPTATADVSFNDVAKNDAWTPAIAWAVEKGITKGTSETTFGNGTCTRGQIVTFLYRAK